MFVKPQSRLEDEGIPVENIEKESRRLGGHTPHRRTLSWLLGHAVSGARFWGSDGGGAESVMPGIVPLDDAQSVFTGSSLVPPHRSHLTLTRRATLQSSIGVGKRKTRSNPPGARASEKCTGTSVRTRCGPCFFASRAEAGMVEYSGKLWSCQRLMASQGQQTQPSP